MFVDISNRGSMKVFNITRSGAKCANCEPTEWIYNVKRNTEATRTSTQNCANCEMWIWAPYTGFYWCSGGPDRKRDLCPWQWKHHPQTPTVSCCVTSRPIFIRRWGFQFWEIRLERWGEVEVRVRGLRNEGGGGSVGGVRVNASGSFCGRSHWWGCWGILPATVCLVEREKNNQTNKSGDESAAFMSSVQCNSDTLRYNKWEVLRAM